MGKLYKEEKTKGFYIGQRKNYDDKAELINFYEKW